MEDVTPGLKAAEESYRNRIEKARVHWENAGTEAKLPLRPLHLA
jgi:hypothetical protein